MKFTEQFIAIADMTASSNGLIKVNNHRPGTLKYKDPHTGVLYSMHENGYLRRWISSLNVINGRFNVTPYQLNLTRIVKISNSWGGFHSTTQRIMITDMYDMLHRMIKATAKYRGYRAS